MFMGKEERKYWIELTKVRWSITQNKVWIVLLLFLMKWIKDCIYMIANIEEFSVSIIDISYKGIELTNYPVFAIICFLFVLFFYYYDIKRIEEKTEFVPQNPKVNYWSSITIQIGSLFTILTAGTILLMIQSWIAILIGKNRTMLVLYNNEWENLGSNYLAFLSIGIVMIAIINLIYQLSIFGNKYTILGIGTGSIVLLVLIRIFGMGFWSNGIVRTISGWIMKVVYLLMANHNLLLSIARIVISVFLIEMVGYISIRKKRKNNRNSSIGLVSFCLLIALMSFRMCYDLSKGETSFGGSTSINEEKNTLDTVMIKESGKGVNLELENIFLYGCYTQENGTWYSVINDDKSIAEEKKSVDLKEESGYENSSNEIKEKIEKKIEKIEKLCNQGYIVVESSTGLFVNERESQTGKMEVKISGNTIQLMNSEPVTLVNLNLDCSFDPPFSLGNGLEKFEDTEVSLMIDSSNAIKVYLPSEVKLEKVQYIKYNNRS